MIKIYITPATDLKLLEIIQTQFTACGIPSVGETAEQKVTQKWLKTAENGSLLVEDDVYLLANGMKVSPNWQALQQRIVTAGKKNELLLKASKLQAGMQVIDATAGFGHDSLILASTGANVAMIEQNPRMFVLLQHEITKMKSHPHWQKLMNRIKLYFGEAVDILPTLSKADVVYLDPMFPNNSYKASQVGKHMQILHTLVTPPTFEQELQLFDTAKHQLNASGRGIVKRPKHAPYLANKIPQESWQGGVLRYDCYFA